MADYLDTSHVPEPLDLHCYLDDDGSLALFLEVGAKKEVEEEDLDLGDKLGPVLWHSH